MANEYVLKLDGRILRRPFEVQAPGEAEINLDTELLTALAPKLISKCPDAFVIPPSFSVGVAQSNQSVFTSFRLTQLVLQTTIVVQGEYTIPSFADKGDVIRLEWTPPNDMRLVFAANLVRYDTHRFYAEPLYLFAIHERVSAYQLPLPNLYNDCHLCTGATPDAYRGCSLQETTATAFQAFEASRWNSHLLRDNGLYEHSQHLFRFRATKTGFDTVPPDSHHWTKLSRKIGTEILQYLAHE